jgi:hypothetical protein
MMRVAIAFLMLLVVAPPCAAWAQAKIALLIGNQAYDRSVGVLKNPHNDISVVDGALRHAGCHLRQMHGNLYEKT